MDQSRAAALQRSVMRNNVDVDPAKFVERAHQLHFLVVSQIAQIKQPQLAKSEKRSQGARVLRFICRIPLGIFAARVLLSRPRQWLADQFAVGADDRDLHAAHRKGIAWFRHNVFELVRRQNFLIRIPPFVGGRVRRLAVNAVVDKRSYRDPCENA